MQCQFTLPTTCSDFQAYIPHLNLLLAVAVVADVADVAGIWNTAAVAAFVHLTGLC